MRNLVLACLLVSSSTAMAVPGQLTHQGRLLDQVGVPLDGAHQVDVALYDTPAGGTASWSESHSAVDFNNGYYTITLGQTTAIDVDVVDVSSLHMALAIDGGPEMPTRWTLQSVPYAILAGDADRAVDADHAASADHATNADNATNAETATNLSGGTVDATSIMVNGTTVIDGSGAISAALPSHDHDAAQVTTGTFDILRLPIGTSSGTVAAGDHLHTMADLDIGPHTSDASAHHGRYTDSEAVSALSGHTGDAAAHHAAYTDSDAVAALSGHTGDAAAHHAAYTDADAIGALGLATGHTIPRIFRSQATSGNFDCNPTRTLPGQLSFQGNAGDEVTLHFSFSYRPNANGHSYVQLYLNEAGAANRRIGSSGEWANSTWRRTDNATINVTLASSGTHVFYAQASCGNGTGSMNDTGGEWPDGGLSYVATVGG